MIGGMTGVLSDVIPFGLSLGNRNYLNGINLIGLIYLSRLSVRPNLKIPGKSGRLLTRVFFYFEGLTTSWSTSRGKLLERLDHTLIKAGEAGPKETRIVEESTHTTPIGFILTFCIVSANWILLVLSKTGFLDP